jgi:hypothetical protein
MKNVFPLFWLIHLFDKGFLVLSRQGSLMSHGAASNLLAAATRKVFNLMMIFWIS